MLFVSHLEMYAVVKTEDILCMSINASLRIEGWFVVLNKMYRYGCFIPMNSGRKVFNRLEVLAFTESVEQCDYFQDFLK